MPRQRIRGEGGGAEDECTFRAVGDEVQGGDLAHAGEGLLDLAQTVDGGIDQDNLGVSAEVLDQHLPVLHCCIHKDDLAWGGVGLADRRHGGSVWQ